MSKTSILIPACNEVATTNEGVNALVRTVQDIYEKATGDFEVIVGFNGPPYQDLSKFPGIRVLYLPENIGLKAMINNLAIMAKGKYLYKSDAHCLFGKGFDEILQENMQDNWLVMPRFYVLNGKTWQWQDDRFYDYFYLCCPFTDPRGFRFKAGGHWPERTQERLTIMLDETPQIHGSGWFVERNFFLNKIGGFPINDPMGHAQEGPNLCLKYWLGPWSGKVMVNKDTWYAHLHQSGENKGYYYGRTQEEISYRVWARYWLYDLWGERKYDFKWFVNERFPNIPTWPNDWEDRFTTFRKEHPEYEK